VKIILFFFLCSIFINFNSFCQIPYDTSVYSDVSVINGDTIVTLRSDLDFLKYSRQWNFDKAIKNISDPKYLDSGLNVNYYKAIFFSLLNKPDSAVYYMLLDNNNKYLIRNAQYFDSPDFYNCLNNSKYLTFMDSFFLNNIRYFKNPSLTKILYKIGLKDQAYYSYLKFIEKLLLDNKQIVIDSIWQIKTRLQNENELELKSIIFSDGWPTIEKVGFQASSYAFLVVQHSNNIQFQKIILDTLERYAFNQEVDINNFALLKDRYLLRTGRKQIYGTQVRKFDDGFTKLDRHISIDSIDFNRKIIGLRPLDEYLERFNIKPVTANYVVNPSFEIGAIAHKKLSSLDGYVFVGERDESFVMDLSLKSQEKLLKSCTSYCPDGQFVGSIYPCSKGNFHTNITGSFKETLKKGSKFVFSFYSNNCSMNPHPLYINVYFAKNYSVFDSYQYDIKDSLQFKLRYNSEWELYSDTLVMTEDCNYYTIGNLSRGKCLKVYENPEESGSIFYLFDDISMRALNSKQPEIQQFINNDYDSIKIRLYYNYNESIPIEWNELDNFLNEKVYDKIKVISYTDTIGSIQYNNSLSIDRAKMIKLYLEKHLDIIIPIEVVAANENNKYIRTRENRYSEIVFYKTK